MANPFNVGFDAIDDDDFEEEEDFDDGDSTASSPDFEEGYISQWSDISSERDEEDERLRSVFQPKVVTDKTHDFFSSYLKYRYDEMLNIVNDLSNKMFLSKEIERCNDDVWKQWRQYASTQQVNVRPPPCKEKACDRMLMTEEKRKEIAEWAESEALKRLEKRFLAEEGKRKDHEEYKRSEVLKRRQKRQLPSKRLDAQYSVEMSKMGTIKKWTKWVGNVLLELQASYFTKDLFV
jgi:hypothetical protein